MERSCSICKQRLSTEKFGSNGEAVHVCVDCRQSTSKEDRRKILLKGEVLGFFRQRSISSRNCTRLHEIIETAEGDTKRLAEAILRVGEVFPVAKQRRGYIYKNDRALFDELVALGLVSPWEQRKDSKGASQENEAASVDSDGTTRSDS